MGKQTLHDQTKRKAADERRHEQWLAKQNAKWEALKALARVPK